MIFKKISLSDSESQADAVKEIMWTPRSCHSQNIILRTLLLGATFVILIIFSLTSRSTPWADEWYMLPLESKTSIEWLHWLFERHNDHVIPIQRLLQYIIIKISGYDFKSLILLNIFAIVGSAWAVLKTAEYYRGKSSLSDVGIVLALCCVGPNAVTWSSTFAFPATNFLVAIFTLILMRITVNGVDRSLQTIAVLLLCAGPFIGAGGAVATTVLCICLWFIFVYRKDIILPFPLIGLFIATVVNAQAWFLFRPSGASGISLDRIPEFILGLAGSSIYWWKLPLEAWKDIFCLAFILAVVSFSIFVLFNRNQNCPKTIWLAVAILSIFSVMLSIAIGRSSFTEWYPHLKVHYGISTAMLIPLGLILLERKLLIQKYLKRVFILLFAISYVLAFQYQVAYLNSVRPTNFAAIHRLAYSRDLTSTISKNWLDYWWREEDYELSSDLAMRVKFMRSHGGRVYQPWG